ncbi:hypothetical protein [Psychromarinibacter sediminicola]|nr:hypothetical protein [Psychromarinibacter sediminicola]
MLHTGTKGRFREAAPPHAAADERRLRAGSDSEFLAARAKSAWHAVVNQGSEHQFAVPITNGRFSHSA